MLERIEEIRAEAAAAIEAAGGTAELEELRVRYLGRKAELTAILRGIAELPAGGTRARSAAPPTRPARSSRRCSRRAPAELDAPSSRRRLAEDRVDVTLPGAPPRPVGHLHLITRTTRQIEDVMVGLGYRVARGPGDRARLLQLHRPQPPARAPGADAPGHLLRAVAPRGAAAHPHLAGAGAGDGDRSRRRSSSIVPGKVYRRDSDATHSPMFHQVEGLAIGEGITLADLQGTLLEMLRAIFGDEPRGAAAAALLPLHRAQRRGRRLLLPVRRHRRAGRRRALQPLQGQRLDRDPRRRHGRPQRARLRRRQRLRPRAGPGLRLRASGSSGSRCCATASPTCGASSTTTCGCWSSSR